MPALFYHLTRSTLEETAAAILSRAVGQGWRVVLRGPDRPILDRLDRALWAGEDTFLPHGLAGGPHDADQPVLLTDRADLPNDPRALMTVAGAKVTAAEVARLDRVWILFDGRDDQALDRARDQWRALTRAGSPAQYWSEEDGRWRMVREA
ncbi:DNA polymerase III subunit chi [Frigidibacter oleivorans]|uniref:DNA polymerase III subunit chi n=1 Tax=Frigidibacter oleivorans TaxID=2487129 RepID=UPI000F8F3F48|nr:DNA polymerase III subunit chi [Frigidibacter oleivorans]